MIVTGEPLPELNCLGCAQHFKEEVDESGEGFAVYCIYHSCYQEPPYEACEEYEIATALEGQTKNPHAAALGRRGGRVGGLARAAALTPERRAEIAQKAAQARWSKVARVSKPVPAMSNQQLQREIARLRSELELIRDTALDYGEDWVPVAWLVDWCNTVLAGVSGEEEGALDSQAW